jgi:hypothetical protein
VSQAAVRGLAAVALAVPSLVGCGYTMLGSSGGPLLGRVAIHTPHNDSGHSGTELVVADALRREVLRRAGAELVEDESDADWVVTGRVLPLEVEPASLSPVVLTLEYQLHLSLELKARARDGREIQGDATELRESERFLSSGDPEAQRKNRGEALRRVSRLLAARFLDRLDEQGG